MMLEASDKVKGLMANILRAQPTPWLFFTSFHSLLRAEQPDLLIEKA
jgi:hypothetical protein